MLYSCQCIYTLQPPVPYRTLLVPVTVIHYPVYLQNKLKLTITLICETSLHVFTKSNHFAKLNKSEHNHRREIVKILKSDSRKIRLIPVNRRKYLDSTCKNSVHKLTTHISLNPNHICFLLRIYKYKSICISNTNVIFFRLKFVEKIVKFDSRQIRLIPVTIVKYSDSMHRNFVFGRTILIFHTQYLICSFFWIKNYKISCIFNTSDIFFRHKSDKIMPGDDHEQSPMELGEDSADDIVRMLDQHREDNAKFVEVQTQLIRNIGTVLGQGVKNKHDLITNPVVDGDECKNITNSDRMYFRNFNPGATNVNKDNSLTDETGTLPGFMDKDKDVIHDVIPPSCITPYKNISSFLSKNVFLEKKRVWKKPPDECTPVTPYNAPSLTLIPTENGGKAVTKLPVEININAPNFYGEKKAGYAMGVADFNCKESYTSTFDLLRRCIICSIEHDVFPQELVGTLIVGDAYTPCYMGGGGRCVPIFRLHNASFREIAYKLRFLLKTRKNNDGEFLGTPRLIIISLPAYLKAVGVAVYLDEFNKFKCWAMHFLSSKEDINPADHRIFKPCLTPVRVYEGFALHKQGDLGLAESFAVIARSLDILTAVEPSQDHMFFYDALVKTMTNFCTQPPPKQELTGYVAIEPVTRDFNVYDYKVKFTGLPASLVVDGIIDPEVTFFFTKQLVSLIHSWYDKNGIENFISSLPGIENLVSENKSDQERQEVFSELPFQSGAENNNRVFISGNSNFAMVHAQLSKSLDEEVVYIKYPFNAFAKPIEIQNFMDKLKLRKGDILVLEGQGNSLIQGMLTPKYKRHQPSGVPAEHVQTGSGKSKVYHAINVAPYDAEYFNVFGIFFKNIMETLSKSEAKVIFVTPLPRYMRSCCTQAGHFYAGFSGNEFNAEIIRLGTFLSRIPSVAGSFVLTPEDFCDRDNWVSRGNMISDDYVHLTPKAINLVRDSIQRCVHYLRMVPEVPVPSLGSYVPEGMLFSDWIDSFRSTCGFDDLRSSGNAKRQMPAHKSERPAKR